jgi:DNA-binding response OmpR family regulator
MVTFQSSGVGTAKRKILIVEDDRDLLRLLSFHLTASGYSVFSAENGIEAVETYASGRPDLVLLDILLPRIDGWEVCRRIRQEDPDRNTPIIILTALAEVENKLKGFALGADDYITKPFSLSELTVRVKRVLSRSLRDCEPVPVLLGAGLLEIDMRTITVRRDGREIPLTLKERAILAILASQPGQVVSSDELLDAVWGDADFEYGNIEAHISNIREKIEPDPGNARFIRTVKGEGYILEV